MSRRTFATVLVAIFTLGLVMRVVWLRADPPSVGSVGIVWHDEGAWVHNARNRALWGVWRTDAWNPVFVAPVFTALEYGAFRAFGVGTWQARVVPVASGLAALAGLVVGLLTLSGRRAAVAGGLLLATNYAFVMWNRAALMESTVAAWLVLAWAAYALADRRPGWGLVAGAAAVAAWFTKASAAFFLAALVLDVAIRLLRARQHTRADEATTRTRAEVRTGRYVLAGLALAAGAVVAFFVLPHWSEYRFYNWQMSVTRKPAYSIGALVDRASWLPIVEGLFSRMWIELVIGSVALVTIGLRWRTARPAERLLVLWVVIGLAELVAHDSGNERRYVVFIPAFIALASLVIGAAGPLLPESFAPPRGLPARVWSLGLILVLGYLIAGSLLRPLLRAEIEAGHLSPAVRLGAGLAAVLTMAAAWRWSALVFFARGRRLPALAGTLCVAAAVGWNAVEFTAWTRRHTQENYEASVALGRLLPAGTLVQGKLANGLALENRIRPLFVGNGFGNYADRLHRDDVRYILTYDRPRLGYESSDGSGLIQGILNQYPQRRVIATFDVDETPGVDRAVLIDKFPDGVPRHARD